MMSLKTKISQILHDNTNIGPLTFMWEVEDCNTDFYACFNDGKITFAIDGHNYHVIERYELDKIIGSQCIDYAQFAYGDLEHFERWEWNNIELDTENS